MFWNHQNIQIDHAAILPFCIVVTGDFSLQYTIRNVQQVTQKIESTGLYIDKLITWNFIGLKKNEVDSDIKNI